MRRMKLNRAAAIACLCLPWAASWSQTAPAAAAPAARVPAGAIAPTEDPADRREPSVQHTVIEDGGSRIDELVVRGQVQRVVVTPKVGTTKAYEILVGHGGRESVDGTGGVTSAVGKRVWSVLAF